mmetsp:Transcript_10331/g.18277  ORF Transcript_10331/g.18277 Transcript_10331/m.18277 type:complete len:318 (+) Transcript_10331:64-1017(+)
MSDSNCCAASSSQTVPSCCGSSMVVEKSKTTTPSSRDEIHRLVRESYGSRATTTGKSQSSCCCKNKLVPSAETSRNAEKMGYSVKDIESVPEDANLGLGCGAPLQKAAIEKGMTVLDLGSGAGFDSFLAANLVGPKGRVIGVDMTPEMVQKAQHNAQKRAARLADRKETQPRIDFYLGLIEELPLEDNLVDVVISNCVINLSPDKKAVFREAYRVLKPGGKICVSDIVLTQPLPQAVRDSLMAYLGCIAGASLIEEYVGDMRLAGFEDMEITTKQAFDVLACDDPIVAGAVNAVEDESEVERLKTTIVSATVVAYKK